MWEKNFIVIMQVRVSALIMQVVFCTVHYVHDCFYCNFAGDCFCYNYAGDSFRQRFYIPFWNCRPLFIKLTKKHLQALYQVCILPLL